MYIDNSHSFILNLITIGLFLFPLLWTVFTRKLFQNFNANDLIIAFNQTLIFQIFAGILLIIISFFIDKLIYTNDNGNLASALFIEATYYYSIIGFFYYLPFVGIMNIINWVTKK
jgi:hypothetical protein